jgi:hypothetical protein
VSVPTVVWWRQDADDRLSELLVVGPGPIPGQAWPGTIAQPARTPGDWAVVNLPALDALPDDLTERLRATAGDEEAVVAERDATLADRLYADCVHAALTIVGRRLAEPIVATEPFSGGVLLARSAPGGLTPAAIELAPAIISPEGPVVGVPVLIDQIEQLASGSVAISLGAAEPATLPSVSISPPPDLAQDASPSLALAVPDLRLPAELLDRWRPSAGEDPRLRLAL